MKTFAKSHKQLQDTFQNKDKYYCEVDLLQNGSSILSTRCFEKIHPMLFPTSEEFSNTFE